MEHSQMNLLHDPIIIAIALLIAWLIYFQLSTVKVIKVSDGDGFRAVTSIRKRDLKIRMAGIDAPEITQIHGEQSALSLISRIHGKRVWIKQIAQDKYGRSVCKVWDIWGDICAHQVFWGHAWNYKEYGGRYYFEEWFARGNWRLGFFRLGLWKQKNPMPPWEWRKKNKDKVVTLPVKQKVKKR